MMNYDDIKIVTLCGSSRFKDEFEKQENLLALQGYAVLSLNIFSKSDNKKLSDEELELLRLEHFKKIEISDMIFVINKDGYIGKDTVMEINFALKLNKKVKFLEEKINIDYSTKSIK